MFEHYKVAKKKKRPAWVIVLVTVSIVAHAGVAAGMLVHSMWAIEKLTPPESRSSLSLGAPPPPPPPKGSGKKKPDSLKKKIARKKVTDMVQPQEEPEDIKPDEVIDDSDDGEDFGVEGGVEGGVAGGVVGGVLGGVPGGTLGGTGGPPPPPPPPEKPQIVPQVALKANFISGDRNPVPPESVKILMTKTGESRTVATVKMCLTVSGGVQSVRLVKSSGYQEYDQKILRSMRGWKYRPFKVNGKPTPVCTAVTFIYRQS